MKNEQDVHPWGPPVELVDEARRDIPAFRTKTIHHLRAAGYHGSANAVHLGRWPTGTWSTILANADPMNAPRGFEQEAAAHAVLVALARDHLGALAWALGFAFVWSDEREDFIEQTIEGTTGNE